MKFFWRGSTVQSEIGDVHFYCRDWINCVSEKRSAINNCSMVANTENALNKPECLVSISWR